MLSLTFPDFVLTCSVYCLTKNLETHQEDIYLHTVFYLMSQSNPLTAYTPIRTLNKDRHYTDKCCRHSHTQAEVLIRRLRKKDCIANNLLTTIENETKIMKKIASKLILSPSQLYQNSEYIYSIFPIDQKSVSLQTIMKESKVWGDKEIREVAAQILSAISLLHNQGYYHSNIQPKSFIVGKSGYVQLTNFFHIRKIQPVNSRKKDRLEVQIPQERHNYLAPEMFDLSLEENQTIDFWGLGAILYHFYYGKSPMTVAELENARKLLGAQVPSDDTAPKDAQDLLRRLLKRNSERLGKGNISEIKKHPYFSGIDWNFVRPLDKLKNYNFPCGKFRETEEIWRQLYHYDIPEPLTRDLLYFPSFTPIASVAAQSEPEPGSMKTIVVIEPLTPEFSARSKLVNSQQVDFLKPNKAFINLVKQSRKRDRTSKLQKYF